VSNPGDTFDRYVIEAVLGEGGMGRVYRAFDPRLGRRVALKVLVAGDARDPARVDAAARMQREARAAAAFSHPNVVAIYDVGEFDGAPFIAMELVSGTTFRAVVGDAGVSDIQKLAWLLDVARGLGAAHRAGLVHRDIKPENVMITTDGVLKILDFGIARRSDGASLETTGPTLAAQVPSITAEGLMIGTPQYMAPEQLRGDALDGRADQFAWGVMAWQVLAGRLPWPAGGGAQLITSVLTLQVPALNEVHPATDRRTAEAIARSLSKRREDRFETMEALLSAIGGAHETPIVVRSSPDMGLESRTKQGLASTRPPALAIRARGSRTARVAVAAGIVVCASVVAMFMARRPHGPSAAAVSTSDASARSACATNAECALRNGKPSLCRKDDGACVALEPEECKAFAEPADLTSDDTVWIGGMIGKAALPWSPGTRAFDLARREISHAGGLPPLHGSDRRRPLGIIVCRSIPDELAAAKRLGDLRVPVVVGAVRAVESIASVFLPHDIAVITTSPDERLTRVQPPEARPRLVWRGYLAGSGLGDAVGSFVTESVSGALGPSGKPAVDARVEIVTSAHQVDAQLTDAVISALTIGGRSAGELSDVIRETVIDAASTEPSVADSETIARFAPSAIVMRTDYSPAWLERLEASWPRARPKPIYVFFTSLDAPALAPFVGRDASRRRRFFAVDTPANTEGNVKFAMRFNATYGPDATTTPGTAPSVEYDPVYVAALAIVAAGDRPLTGHAVADGIARLVPPGPTIGVGSAHLYEAFDALSRGERIDLAGAGTPLDFDVATGESSPRTVVYCLKETPTGLDAIESGVSYEIKSKSLTGMLRCP